MSQRIRSAFWRAAPAAVLTFGMAACGDDEPGAVVPPPPLPQFQPQAIEVALGGSGQSVTLMTAEGGGHTLDGEAFASGGTRAVTVNGIEISYTLTLADGSWSASCACEVEVALGASGNTATVALNDADGTFSLGGEDLASGDQRMGYVFALEGGSWTASFVPVSQTVDLGALGGTLELTQVEGGSWIGPDGAVLPETGATVTSGGNVYALTRGEDGTWTATFNPATKELAGTGLAVRAREDGSYEIAGMLLEFDEDGMDSVTLETGERYLVTRNENGTLQGARQEIALDGDTADSLGNSMDGDSATVEDFFADPELTNENTELRFRLNAEDPDPQFSITNLFADGTDEASGGEFVAGVIADIREIRADAVLLLEALEDDNTNLGNLLGSLWDDIDEDLDRVFGTDGADDIGTAPEPDDFLEDVDEILAALASEDALLAADDGDGVFEREFSGDYGARDWAATAWLRSMGSMRYGVVSFASRNHANDEPGPARLGSFRYSTTSETGLLREIADRSDLSGDLLYDGETIAIDGTGEVYSGDIAVQVRLAGLRVNGMIDNLAASDGSLWEPSFAIAGRGVQTITLPQVVLGRNARWSSDLLPGGFVTVSTRAGLNRRVGWDFSYRGLLLGLGEGVASEVVGDWGTGGPSVQRSRDWIRGAFGATLSGVDGIKLPGVDESGTVIGATIANIDPTEAEPANAPRGIDFDDTDDELLLGDLRQADGSRWALDLAAAYETQGTRQEDSAEQWVALARAELETLRGRLVTLHQASGRDDIDDTTLVAAEASIWNAAMDEVARLLFGTDDKGTPATGDDGPYTGDQISGRFPDTSDTPPEGRGYPSASGATARTDDEALDIIDDLLEALASKSNYQDAYEDGGIFANVGTVDLDMDTAGDQTISDNDGGDDFDRVQSRVTSLAGATVLTRFGIFWGTETASAVDEGLRADLGGMDSSRAVVSEEYSNTGLYAYSELDRVRYSTLFSRGRRDPTFPLGGSATYSGEAVAAYNDILYTGAAEVLVTWKRSFTTVSREPGSLTSTFTREIGRMEAAFSLQRLDDGDRFVRESDDVAIDEIVFSNSLLVWNDDGTIGTGNRAFQGEDNGLAVAFWNRTDARYSAEPLGSDDGTATGADDTDDLRQHLAATFVGRTDETPAGVTPAGVMGYFKVQNADPNEGGFRFNNRRAADRAADTGVNANTEALVGAFGADLDPDSIRAGLGLVDPPPIGRTASVSNHPEIDADRFTWVTAGRSGGAMVPGTIYHASRSVRIPTGRPGFRGFGVFWRSDGMEEHEALADYGQIGAYAFSTLPDVTETFAIELTRRFHFAGQVRVRSRNDPDSQYTGLAHLTIENPPDMQAQNSMLDIRLNRVSYPSSRFGVATQSSGGPDVRFTFLFNQDSARAGGRFALHPDRGTSATFTYNRLPSGTPSQENPKTPHPNANEVASASHLVEMRLTGLGTGPDQALGYFRVDIPERVAENPDDTIMEDIWVGAFQLNKTRLFDDDQ